MISKFEEILDLFEQISKKVKSKIDLFLIGGAALMYYGSKEATKDIDLVVTSEKEYSEFKNALLNFGFNAKKLPKLYEHVALSDILVKYDFRIDIFNKVVCQKLCVSPRMQKRSKKIFETDKIKLFLFSKEDIFLFKSITFRPGDKDDGVSLIRQGINWEIILDELIKQVKENGEEVWVTYVNERFDELEELGIFIPIKKEIEQFSLKYYKKWGDLKK
ncbi:hypothetical protein HZA97_05755 [Candidatus Woesearchaeota archaeon]|nr:hypothetical protein [Candidatus Woesearchaeota archaeon]